jgi:polysaccharide chain length determinant protein (PEP-CTERM system associated)
MLGRTRGSSGLEWASDIWRRRRSLAIVIFTGTFSVVASFAAFLPDLYRSTATVLVERQQVPETFVRASVTGELETRLHTISQETLSRARLQELIDRFQLYPDLQGLLAPEAVVEQMRRDIRLDLKGVEAFGGQGATIAFELSYQGRDPDTVAQVTNTLASFYIDENARLRGQQASDTASFLKTRLEEAKKRLDERESQLAAFKARRSGELPEQMEVNLATLERLTSQLRLNHDSQLRLTERRESLLRQLQGAGAPGTSGPDADAAARLARLRGELSDLRSRYSDRYPDVTRLKAEIAALESEENAAGDEDGAAAMRVSRPRPLVDVDARIRALKEEDAGLRKSIASYQRRLENIPRTEQDMRTLTRNFETAKDLHDTLLKRHEEAQLAETMEQSHRAEQFRVLDPAVPARHPAAPNRMWLLLLGLALATGTAAGVAALAERLDASFHSTDDLKAYTRVPVLASIPAIVTASDRRRRRVRISLAAASGALSVALIVGVSYFLAHENEAVVRLLARGRI